MSWRTWRFYIYGRRTEITAPVESETGRILLCTKPSLPFASCACVLEQGGRMMGRGLGRGKGRGVMGRAAVHPSALYPQSKHDKWESSLAWLKMKTRIHLHPKSLAQGGEKADGKQHAHGGTLPSALRFMRCHIYKWGWGVKSQKYFLKKETARETQ